MHLWFQRKQCRQEQRFVNMIFETHAHYEDKKFDKDRDILLQELLSGNICNIVNVGSSLKTSEKSLVLADSYPQIYAAIGVHPSDIEDLNEETFQQLEKWATHSKVVAIGEIGLDYYWDKEPEVQEKQREWFKRQLELAKKFNLPVIIHSRDAAEDTMKIMREAAKEQIPGVIHCYSYSKEMAREYVKMGYYIGVGGVITFKNAKKLIETVQEIPIEHIVVETDCPYMAPEPNRGKRNDSGNLKYVIEKIAEIKGVMPEEVEQITRENACRLYHLIK